MTAPIDLRHLARQTMGDDALRREVLALFTAQLSSIHGELVAADVAGRGRLAHTLKGSARGVGAFALADCAAAIEADPADDAAIARIPALIAGVRDFIAAMDR